MVLVIMLGSGTPASAEDLWDDPGPLRKLGRGVANVVTSPFELHVQGMQVYRKHGLFACASWGMARGLFRMCTRIGAGLVEVVTFPIPLWAHGYRPLVEPEFIWMPKLEAESTI